MTRTSTGSILSDWVRIVDEVNGMDHRDRAMKMLAAVVANRDEIEVQAKALRRLMERCP